MSAKVEGLRGSDDQPSRTALPPGPWTTTVDYGDQGERCFVSIRCANGFTIASTWETPQTSRYDHDANARLIAAAPDLVEALKDAEWWLEGWASAEPYLSRIRAALAKVGSKASECGEQT